MKVVVAIDSFKGSVSSLEAGYAARNGILQACPDAKVKVLPLADGGEGTCQALYEGLGGSMRKVMVQNPVNETIESEYLILNDGKTAVIEMAKASGLVLIPKEKQNPLFTTTFGVGQLIKDAIKIGCRKFIVGIGGSATNDGGIGMLEALGYRFKDQNGDLIRHGAVGIDDLFSIDSSMRIKELNDCEFMVACDVSNPLLGENGASFVYGPQKGAKEDDIQKLDLLLKKYAELTYAFTGKDLKYTPGAGAAGGLGFAFISFLKAKLESGIKIVMDAVKLEDYVKSSDVVITGEGRLDSQSASGKAPVGVAFLGKKYGKKVIAICGSTSDDAVMCNSLGIDAFFPVIHEITTLEEALDRDTALKNIELTALQVFRLISRLQ
ncbi:MAG: glycerate kinase [Succinivibrio sp.]